jgi:GxxExxY protein
MVAEKAVRVDPDCVTVGVAERFLFYSSRKGAKAQRLCEERMLFVARAKAQRRKDYVRDRMTENEIARQIVDAAYKIHTRLGPGLLESVYEAVLVYELRKRGLRVVAQQAIALTYEGVTLDVGFRADIIVEDKVIVELKSVEQVAPVHKKQLITYLRLANKRLGLLINFGEELIKNGITRLANGM